MSTERFSLEQFEEILTSYARAKLETGVKYFHGQFIGNEMRYDLPVSPHVSILVNSSIDRSGFAADTGENSIRAWLVDDTDSPIGSKTQKYVTRVKGWEARLISMLDKLMKMASHINKCKKCGAVEKIFIVKKDGPNKGRTFKKCECQGNFQWVDLDEDSDAPKQPELPISSPSCPRCAGAMKKRNGRRGEFWGCANYPKCTGTRDLDWDTKAPVVEDWKHTPVVKEFIPSIFQQAVFDWAINRKPNTHLVIKALAGTGKTTTGVEMLKRLPRGLRVLFVAFGSDIAKTIKSRVPQGIRVSTFHSLGFAAIRAAYPNVKIDSELGFNKTQKILRDYWGDFGYGENKIIIGEISKLVSLVKANLTNVDDAALEEITTYYDIALNGSRDMVFDAVRYVIHRGLEMCETVIDFDDMPYVPVVKNLAVEQYDIVYVDEAQDTNICQLELVLKAKRDNGSIIACGDEYQSIYGFRGADAEAIPNIISRLNAEILPLSITYRCSAEVVKYVNAKFPEIPLQASPTAIQGAVLTETYNRFLQDVVKGDMVLCRVNAPLVRPVYSLISRGIKATIRGRDIGKGLISLIRKLKATTVTDLLQKLGEYQYKEVEKLLVANKKNAAEALQDKCSTIIAISDGVYTIREMEDKINSIFTDDDDDPGIVFSSVHKAKGLEATNIYILKPELMPHPRAESDWELQQERNLEYVACTRALDKLVFVNGY